MPACLVILSSEERDLVEKKLLRKIDLRLLRGIGKAAVSGAKSGHFRPSFSQVLIF
jgi:hypothetical protein